MSEWKKICCAIDAAEPSRAALDEAVDLAAQLRAGLTLVHVLPPPLVAASHVLVSSRGVAQIEAAEVEKAVEARRADAERRLGAPVAARLLTGNPAAEIARFAREGGFDLVVVGAHGGAILGRLVLGSIAERVVREAPCPVLVARPRLRSEAEEIAAEVAQYH